MAASKLDEIALRLIAAGRAPSTPVAIVAQASLPGQSLLRTSLGQCTLEARRAGLPTPALVVIGEVVELAAALLPAESVAARDRRGGAQAAGELDDGALTQRIGDRLPGDQPGLDVV